MVIINNNETNIEMDWRKNSNNRYFIGKFSKNNGKIKTHTMIKSTGKTSVDTGLENIKNINE